MLSSPVHRRSLLARASLAVTLLVPFMTEAAVVTPPGAHGKKVLHAQNETKLEKAKPADPADPKRIATLATWRDNDEKAMAYLRSLGSRPYGHRPARSF